jgi:putative RecB family exonuclease
MTSDPLAAAQTLPPHTSASQLVTYAMCPRKYALSYVYGFEPEFRSTALLLGSALHSAVAWWFGEKIGGRSPSVDKALEVLDADLLAGTVGDRVRWKAATPETLEADGRRFLRLYLAEHGDMPVVAVEEPFSVDLVHPDTGECLGRALKGYFDLTLEDHTVVEIKTSARGWNEADLVRHLQVGAYAFAWNALHGGPSRVEVHTIVKLKREPRVEVFKVERGEPHTRWWLEAAAAIERAIEARHFPPSPGPMCHECEYDSACAAWTSELPEIHAPRRTVLVQADSAFACDL